MSSYGRRADTRNTRHFELQRFGAVALDAERQFMAAMRERDLAPPQGRIMADGKIHRCDVVSKGRSGRGDGTYALYSNGPITAGWFRNWTDNGGTTNWCGNLDRPLRPQEQRELKRLKEQSATAVANMRERTRRKALRLWRAAAKARDGFPYCQSKQVKPVGLRISSFGSLLVPMYDARGKLQNLQMIDHDGRKRFLKGGRVTDAHYWVANLGEAEHENTIVICEGWATGESLFQATRFAVVVAFSASNVQRVAELVREAHPNHDIIIAADDDWKTAGNPGLTSAQKAAQAVQGRVAVPKFGPDRASDQKDFNDLLVASGRDAVRRCIDAAQSPEEYEHDDPLIDELAKLPSLKYEQRRREAAKTLNVRATILDKIIASRREQFELLDGRDFLQEVEPWPQAVDGADLLSDLCHVLERHVVLPKYTTTAIALWILHCYAHDAARHSPILDISSPTKRCGKTNLLAVLSMLVPKPLSAANVTAATIFRAIDRWRPTMLIDEMDTFVADKSELRGTLNSGHTKSQAYVIRCVGDDAIPKQFSTWAPKAFAHIGRVHPTLEDRSITIALKRKLRTEKLERIPKEAATYDRLRRQCARWAKDNIEALKPANPQLPDMNDRARDNWEPLLAISDTIGPQWAAHSRKVAQELSGIEDDETLSIVLLRDLKRLFQTEGNKLSSTFIADELAKMEDRPWPEFNRGQPITPTAIAKLLKPFKIMPRQLAGERKAQGYRLEQFNAVFGRYLDDGHAPQR